MTDSVLDSPAASTPTKTPIHLWIVGGLSLLWHCVGFFDFLATLIKFEPYMSNFTAEQLEYFYGFPLWVNVLWLLGTGGALLGSVFLLMRRRWAVEAFTVSLIAMVGTSLYTMVLTDGIEIMGTGVLYFSAVIYLVAIGLLYYSWRQAQRGVLR